MYKHNYNAFDFEDPQEEWRSKNGRSADAQSQKTITSTSELEESFMEEGDKPINIKSMSEVKSGSATFIVEKGRSGSPYSYSGPMTSTPKREFSQSSQNARPTRDTEFQPKILTDQFIRESAYATNQEPAFESNSSHTDRDAPPLKPKPLKKKSPKPSPRRMMLEGAKKTLDEEEKRQIEESGKATTGNTFPGRVMFLDENCILHEVEDEQEIVELFRNSSLTGSNKTVHDALQNISTIPIDRLYHTATIGQHLGFLQKNELFFDVVVYVGNQSFKAHKVILSCFSKYFSDSFIASSGKSRNPLEIKLNGISTNAFKIFLEYIYTGIIDLKPEVIGELAIASEFLEISTLKDKTVDFLNVITPDQALVVIETGSIPFTSELYRTSYDVVMENFSECYDTNAFNDLSLENVCTILRDDRLVVFTEMDVFWAALKWIAYHMNERSPHLNKVMECVRFPYLSQAEIFKCLETTDLLRTSDKCKEILIHANWIISSEERNKADLLNLPKPPKRLCFRRGHTTESTDTFMSVTEDLNVSLREAFSCEVYNPVDPEKEKSKATDEVEPKIVPSHQFPSDIIAIGGFQVDSHSSHTDKQMQRYSAKSEQWRFFGELPAPRHHHAAALLCGKIYLAGGANPKRNVLKKKDVATKTVFQYNPEHKSWKLCEPMNSCRMFFKLISLYGILYALAGEDDRHEIQATAECYNPKTNAWVYISSMHWPRMGFAATSCDGKIYVAGGHGQAVGKKNALPILQSMESFDPRCNQWTSLADLRNPRCYAAMVSIHSTLYLCGGATRAFGGDKQAKDEAVTSVGLIETYDVKANEWEYRTEMIVPRHHHGIAVLGGRIFIVGGMSTTNGRTLQSVECLETKNYSWDNSIQDLPLPAKWITCVGLPVGFQKAN